ncbi:MAG TPA: hypothetical protein DEB31_01075 [Clostridiales bacterium]|nr:hypothetical protein [Clostridiales bacterium]
MTAELPGLPLSEAEKRLAERGVLYRVTAYRSGRPYEDADSTRVVRAREGEGGVVELVVCEFKTKLTCASRA